MTINSGPSPSPEVEGEMLLTRSQAEEVVEIVLAARRQARRTRTSFVLNQGKVVDFLKIPPDRAEHVISELRAMVRRVDQAEESGRTALAQLGAETGEGERG